jgi:hypothetical protein
MALQYQGHKSGEIFEPTLGARQSYLLSPTELEQNTEFRTPDNQPAFIRIIYSGSFEFGNGELAQASISDISTHIYISSGPEMGEIGTSLHFGNPLQQKPHEITNEALNLATSVNYSFRSTGSTRPSGSSLLLNYPVTNNRNALSGYAWSPRISDIWWATPFTASTNSTPAQFTGTAKQADTFTLSGPPGYGAGYADRITNFNPKENDRLQIQVSQFDSDAAGTFKIAKNAKALPKALASTTDFIYFKPAGELYYNENAATAGFGNGGVFAVIEGSPVIKAANVGFI